MDLKRSPDGNILEIEQNDGAVERHVWRRAHRPEEYVRDVMKYVANEMGLPAVLFFPLVPVATAVLRGWERAALEHTEFHVAPDGSRMMRTFFEITNYSGSSIYSLVEKLMARMGIGRKARMQQPDAEFLWVLLGGVLQDYAACAGVSKQSVGALLEFRLRNSDYFTATTWFDDFVEIANLCNGRVEKLPLPREDIARIVNWAVRYQKSISGKKSAELDPCGCDSVEYEGLMARYNKIVSGSFCE